jgi:hypothetical protein
MEQNRLNELKQLKHRIKACKAKRITYALMTSDEEIINALIDSALAPVSDSAVQEDIDILNNMIIWNGHSDLAKDALSRAIQALRAYRSTPSTSVTGDSTDASDVQKAIDAIQANWPPENYTILREALTLAIAALQQMKG